MGSPAAAPLLFAIGLAVTLMGPPLLGSGPFPAYPDMKWQDVLDLATPVIVAPLYWLLVRQPASAPRLSRGELLVFLVLLAVWIEAQGMHLAANSINNSIHEDRTAPGAALIHYYDEVLSHYLWHAAMVGLAALALLRQWRYPLSAGRRSILVPVLAGLLFAFTFFAVVVEGDTAPLGIPAAAALAGLVAWRSRGHLDREPVATYTLVGFAGMLVLTAIWAALHGGDLPGFYESGLL